MSLALNDLLICCRQLEHDRATERRRVGGLMRIETHVQTLPDLLNIGTQGAPRLKCQELLNYIMDTVKDSSNGAIYGADCSNILLKDILSVRKYWCEISQQQWTGMF
ncbi:hypothetical protein J1605_017878 [Eschrichtius robustus]|uniref:Telomere-length maintenance and DNA damage repair domain-containing protein n=1 Tax=Eschrichtius robustus TaxID=9764 RepID=A0AB34HUG3_ESCRO|nr:hypothetical protein J1605_017878 [Eschrichtius robustus]